MRNVLAGAVLAGALAAVSVPALGQKSVDTLRITWRDAVPDITPYYNQLRAGVVIGHQIWDSLVYRDPETFQIKPLLAESYKWVDETTLEFTLRNNVTFHNGDKLTADDVAYTINTMLADKQVSIPSNYAYLDHATKVDDTHVRIELKRVFPAALDYMALTLYIMPKTYREKVGPQEYSQHPVAAGPYKVTKINGVTEVDLERYDGYFPDSPKGKPAIGKIVIRAVPDAATEMAELLGGRADWIWKFSPDQFDDVARMPNLQATRAESMRVEYLSMDAAGRAGADSPLTKEKVRQAIAIAIDRPTMAKQLMRGGSRAIDTLLSNTIRLRHRCRSALSLRSREGKAFARRRRLSQRLRHRTRDLRTAAMGRCRASLPEGHRGSTRRSPSCRLLASCSVRLPGRTRWSWAHGAATR
jgi:peptide/nickel transport system substrate-binding protein